MIADPSHMPRCSGRHIVCPSCGPGACVTVSQIEPDGRVRLVYCLSCRTRYKVRVRPYRRRTPR